MKTFLTRAVLVTALLVSGTVSAAPSGPGAEPGSPTTIVDTVRDRLFPGAVVQWVRPTASKHLIAFRLEGTPTTLYVTPDGKLMLPGAVALVDVAGGIDLQLQENAVEAKAALASIPDTDRIHFPASNERHRVTVFTDVDCGYCRKLHEEVAEFNRLGISVDYVLVSRGGPGSDSAKKHAQIACAADKSAALTLAKRGQAVPPSPPCEASEAIAQAAATASGMRGTPHVVTDEGTAIGGYVSPAAALAQLDHLQGLATASKD